MRATVGTERAPAFSMEVLKPDGGSPQTAERIRDEASAYLLSEEEIAAQRAEGRRRVDLWLDQMAEEDDQKAAAPGEATPGGQPPKEPRGNRQRSKRQPPAGSSGGDAA